MPVFVDGSCSASCATSPTMPTSAAWRPAAWPAACRRSIRRACRIPVVRLFRRGELSRTCSSSSCSTCAMPDERRGDYFAQIAACRLGERRMQEIFATLRRRQLMLAAFDEIIARTERRMRAAIAPHAGRALSLRGRDGRRRAGHRRHPDPRCGSTSRATASCSTSPAPRRRCAATSTSPSTRRRRRSATR